MSDLDELSQWSEEEILKELRYLLVEGFMEIVERNGEYYFVLNEDVDNVDEV
jgi:hypothetical protein